MNLQPQGWIWRFRADVAMPYFNWEKKKHPKKPKKQNFVRKTIAPDCSYLRGGVWAGGGETCLSTVISAQKPPGPSAPGWERRALPGTFLQGTLPPAVMVLGDWRGT